MSVQVVRRADGTEVIKVRWRQGGRQPSRTFDPAKLGGKRKALRAAQRFDEKMATALALGDVDVLDRGLMSLAEYADGWWERYARPNLAQSTLDLYAVQLDLRVVPRFGGCALREITPAAVEDWIGWMRRQGVGDPTILKSLTVLQAVLKRAVIDGEIDRNPVEPVRKPRQRRSRDPLAITPAQVEAMRAHLRAQDRLGDATLVALLAYAGPRPESEALPLTWPQIRDRTILLRAGKKHGAERTVRLLAPLAQDLAEWRLARGRPTSGLVFPGPNGGAWTGDAWDNWRDRVFRPAAAAAGFPLDATRRVRRRRANGQAEIQEIAVPSVRPRDLRGSFASLLIYEGMNVVEVARQLGHSPQTCLRDYASVFEEFDPAKRRPAEDVIREARDHQRMRRTG